VQLLVGGQVADAVADTDGRADVAGERDLGLGGGGGAAERGQGERQGRGEQDRHA
jgi:hypothetical protein